jgi:hypothetical protein
MDRPLTPERLGKLDALWRAVNVQSSVFQQIYVQRVVLEVMFFELFYPAPMRASVAANGTTL